jgi:GTPase SAR1 family protein
MSSKVIKIQILDAPGDTKIPAMINSYYNQANAVVLICDINEDRKITK